MTALIGIVPEIVGFVVVVGRAGRLVHIQPDISAGVYLLIITYIG